MQNPKTLQFWMFRNGCGMLGELKHPNLSFIHVALINPLVNISSAGQSLNLRCSMWIKLLFPKHPIIQ
jgi:hypothetical protein